MSLSTGPTVIHLVLEGALGPGLPPFPGAGWGGRDGVGGELPGRHDQAASALQGGSGASSRGQAGPAGMGLGSGISRRVRGKS